jgi:hypothetical protein
MKKILFWIGGVMQILTGCSMSGEPIISGPIVVESYKIKNGQVDDEAIRKGLTLAAQDLANLVADARKINPGLDGWFEGTLRIEPDGTVRMFMQGKSSIQEAGEREIIKDFLVGIFDKSTFPKLGQDCLLWLKFAIKKGN